jgi:hypothetical protein
MMQTEAQLGSQDNGPSSRKVAGTDPINRNQKEQSISLSVLNNIASLAAQNQLTITSASLQKLTDVLAVREAWIEGERAQNPTVTIAAHAVPSGAADPESEPARVDWKG